MIETERLILRPYKEADFEDWYEIFSNQELIRSYGGGLMQDKEESRAKFSKKLNLSWKFAVELKAEKRMIGEFNAAELNPWVKEQESLQGHKGVSVSYAISPRYQRKGFACEIMGAMIEYLFTVEKCDFINAGYFDFNAPSKALQEKFGFSYFGRHTYTNNGETFEVIENILWKR